MISNYQDNQFAKLQSNFAIWSELNEMRNKYRWNINININWCLIKKLLDPITDLACRARAHSVIDYSPNNEQISCRSGL